MIARLANVIYWAAILLAAVTVYGFNEDGSPEWGIMVAVIIMIIGWAVRYILTGSKTFKP